VPLVVRWVDANRAVDFVTRGGSTGGPPTAGQVAALLGVPQTWVYEQSRAGTCPM